MDLRRVRLWEWLTGLAGLVLIVSLFLPWYTLGGGAEASGWDATRVTDIVLALAALAAIALPVLAAMQRTVAVPQGWTALLVYIGLLALGFALWRLIFVPDFGPSAERGAGVWLAAASAIAILAFDYRSMGDKRFPAAMRPRLDIQTIPAPTADGERRDVSS